MFTPLLPSVPQPCLCPVTSHWKMNCYWPKRTRENQEELLIWLWGSWVAQLVRHPTQLWLRSWSWGHEMELCIRFMLNGQSAHWAHPSLPLCPLYPYTRLCSLINKSLKKKATPMSLYPQGGPSWALFLSTMHSWCDAQGFNPSTSPILHLHWLP